MTSNSSTLDHPGDGAARAIRRWLVIRTLGEVLLTVGVLGLFFAVYQFVGVPAEVAHAQRQLDTQLQQSWQSRSGHETPGDDQPLAGMPGEIGNFALAGHRVRGLFFDLDEITPGDFVIVETKDTWFTYRVYQTLVVAPTDLDAIAPNPDQPGAPPRRALLTLTTCNPKWHNYQRLIVHAELDTVRAK